MTDPKNSWHILDKQGRIRRSIPCLGCEYNLRGLEPEGQCPECGISIERTVFRSRLHFADPLWLRRMRSGCTLLTVGLIVNACPPLRFDPDVGVWSSAVWSHAAIAILALGVWRLTTPEPGVTASGMNIRRAPLLRLACIVFAATVVMATVFLILEQSEVMVVLIAAAMFSLAAMNWCLCNYLGQYATRVPDNRLHTVTLFTKWLFSICTFCFGVIALLAPLLGSQSRTGGINIGPYTLAQPIFFAVGPILAIATMVSGILMLVTLWDYRGAFKRAAEFASEHSSSDSSAA